MITLAILLMSITSARADEPLPFRDSAYESLRTATKNHGVTNPVDTEAAVRALADRLKQLHEFRPPLGLRLENARPVVNVASAAMIWLRHLTVADLGEDHATRDLRLATSLGKLVRQAIDDERSFKDATTLRTYAEKTFRHGLRIVKLISSLDPEFAALVALGKTDRLQSVFNHVADSLATECATPITEL